MRVSDVLGDIEKEHWHKMGYNDLTEVMVAFPRHWKHAHTHTKTFNAFVILY